MTDAAAMIDAPRGAGPARSRAPAEADSATRHPVGAAAHPAGFSRAAGVAGTAIRYLLGVVLLVMTLVNVGNAAARYLVGVQMRGADEFLAFSQVAIVMLGLALVTAHRRHLAVDLVPAGWRSLRALRTLALDLLMLAVTGYAALQSWTFVARMWAFGSNSMGLGVPMVIPHAFVFAGFLLTAVTAAALIVFDLAALVRGTRPGAGR